MTRSPFRLLDLKRRMEKDSFPLGDADGTLVDAMDYLRLDNAPSKEFSKVQEEVILDFMNFMVTKYGEQKRVDPNFHEIILGVTT